MNNRFKFRAKRLDNNKFVYGYLCFIYIDNKKHCRIYCPDDTMSYNCDTETLGQCTGLKDKNGKFIYEGDILKAESIKYKVVWQGSSFVLKVKTAGSYPLGGTADLLGVIGNIHENTDLLE